MTKLKQNLFLFLEEKVNESDIGLNLAILAMNRFVVDEDAQFEVIGVYYLKKTIKEMIDLEDLADINLVKQRAEKDAFDRDLISEALDHALLYPNDDTHFIFGTYVFDRTYILCSTKSFNDWFYNEIKKSEIQTLLCTQYFEERKALITKTMSVKFYEGKMNINLQLRLSDSDDGWRKPRSSVHDDLEEFIHHIRNGHEIVRGLENHPVQDSIFLNKMLTPNELKKARNNDEEFWRTISNSNSSIERCKRDYTTKCLDHEKKHKFVSCLCHRHSIRFK